MSKRGEYRATYKSEFHKGFIAAFNTLAGRHGRFDVWTDFITMSACAISNSCDRRYSKKREADYMRCVSKYNPEELKLFAEMLSHVVFALDRHSEQDFLGEIFSVLNLHNEWHGQFFTPYDIAAAMAKMNLCSLGEKLDGHDPVTICDPCCGAGCLLIACANEAIRLKINFQRKMIFFAQDIDRIAALMCYIQLSLLGCRAIIKIGNSLTDPLTVDEPMTENVWLTPMLLCGGLFRIMSMASIEGKENNSDGDSN